MKKKYRDFFRLWNLRNIHQKVMSKRTLADRGGEGVKPIYRYSWDHGQWAHYRGTNALYKLYVLPREPGVLFEPPEVDYLQFTHWVWPRKASFVVNESASQSIH